VEGKLEGAVVARLGSLGWLKSCGISPSDPNGFVEKWSATGETILGVARGSRFTTFIALQDTVKPAAASVVRQLTESGLKVFMVTGDNARTAHAIARAAGIAVENVFAEIRPERKAEIVREFQEKGEKVAFVGDGLNDAPALQQADLGIAVSQASDVAGEAADLVLLNTEIEAIPEALALARATLRTIKQNLFWAFFYNAAGVPLAALGFLSPIVCAAAMGLSDLVVIGNALRLAKTGQGRGSFGTKRAE
jgi:Cu+-exporting ATPase